MSPLLGLPPLALAVGFVRLLNSHRATPELAGNVASDSWTKATLASSEAAAREYEVRLIVTEALARADAVIFPVANRRFAGGACSRARPDERSSGISGIIAAT
jgi:hypothetical protein